jgi:hypothetical protein
MTRIVTALKVSPPTAVEFKAAYKTECSTFGMECVLTALSLAHSAITMVPVTTTAKILVKCALLTLTAMEQMDSQTHIVVDT